MARKKKKRFGFGSDESAEKAEAEKMKSASGSETIEYKDGDSSTAGIETYDSKTGKKEGVITLGPKGNTGLLVPLEITEKVEAHYAFNEEEDIEDDRKVSGELKITNPSDSNKIWDVDLTLEKGKDISLDDELHFKNIEPGAEEILEYEIEDFAPPALLLNEFISTMNDPETLSYTLTVSESTVVYFKITAKNTQDYPITEVKIKKEISEGFMDVDVLEASLGSHEIDGSELVWSIETLEAGEEAEITLNMTVDIPNRDYKPKTGVITAEYAAESSFTGVKIDKFDAYSENLIGMQISQGDEDPDIYNCSVMFRNESDFQMQLVNMDILNAAEEKVLDIDPGEIQPIAAGATWQSVEFEVETEDGEEPQFRKMVEFFLIGERKVSTAGLITMDDIELAVAMIDGILNYDASAIVSRRVVAFKGLMQLKNTGGADLNEITFQENLQAGFKPPSADEVELYIIRPEEGEEDAALEPTDEPDWENLGDQITLDEGMVEISPNDQEPEVAHTITIKLADLRDSSIGLILPGTTVIATYPITAYKVAKDSEFVSDVKYSGNTYPAGAPIEIIPDAVHIAVTHTRLKFIKSKKVLATAEKGVFEIVLSVQNTGDLIENFTIKDVVPDKFEYGEYSLDPVKTDNLEGKDLLIWEIERIDPDETYEITYKITGTGDDYKASDAQLSV